MIRSEWLSRPPKSLNSSGKATLSGIKGLMKMLIIFVFSGIMQVPVYGQQTVYSTASNSPSTYTVPANCTSLIISMNGARGGTRETPGNGGRVVCTLAVTPGLSMNVYVGGVGANNRTAGVGGAQGGTGGAAGTFGTSGAGGGGSSEIRIGGTALANRALVAAGGGGGSGNVGGHGGGLTGGNGGTPGTGTGGTQSGPGGSGGTGAAVAPA